MFVIFLATTILLSVSRWDIAAHGANNVSQIGHKMTIYEFMASSNSCVTLIAIFIFYKSVAELWGESLHPHIFTHIFRGVNEIL